MSNTVTTHHRKTALHLTQRIEGDVKAKLQRVAAEGREAELVRKQATHFLRQQVLENWLVDVRLATQPMGPVLLPKSVRSIEAWASLTPVQKAERKEADIKAAKAARAAAKAKRAAAKKVSA